MNGAAAQKKRIDALMKRFSPKVAKAIARAFEESAGKIDFNELVRAIEAQDFARIAAIVSISGAAFSPALEEIRAAYVGAGRSEPIRRAAQGVFRFNAGHPEALNWFASISEELVRTLSAEATQTANSMIRSGLQEGRSPSTIARDLAGRSVGNRRVGGFIGLSEPIANSIDRAQGLLRSGDPVQMRRYLSLKNRNRTYDSRIKAAIGAEKKLPAKFVREVLEAHKSKALGARAQLIARTETRKAIAAGRERTYEQAIEDGYADNVSIRWQHNLSEFPREDHVAMNGTTIMLGETFNFPDGVSMKYPNDPDGPAEHVIGCRCTPIYRAIVARD